MTKININRLLIFVLPSIVVILGVLDVLVSNEVAPLGAQLQSLNASIESTSSENSILFQQVASYSALLRISDLAVAQGFERPTQNAFMTISSHSFPVALSLPRK